MLRKTSSSNSALLHWAIFCFRSVIICFWGCQKKIKTLVSSINPSIHPKQQWYRLLTGVEVFGFGQFDGGSGLFLQLDNGLTSLPDDRTGCIAGNQNLQEVLAFLCSRKQETGSQRELLHFMLFSTSNKAEKENCYKQLQYTFLVWTFALMPAFCFMTNLGQYSAIL